MREVHVEEVMGQEGEESSPHSLSFLTLITKLQIYSALGVLQNTPAVIRRKIAQVVQRDPIGNLRTTTTTGSEIPCTAQARLTNFVVVVSSTTPNTVESRRPAVYKLWQV